MTAHANTRFRTQRRPAFRGGGEGEPGARQYLIGSACPVAGSEPALPPARDRNRRGGAGCRSLAQACRGARVGNAGRWCRRQCVVRPRQPPPGPAPPSSRHLVSGGNDHQCHALYARPSRRDRHLHCPRRCGGLRHLGPRQRRSLCDSLGWAPLRRVLQFRRSRHRRQGDALKAYGVYFAGGRCPTVGVSGLTLGGGWGSATATLA
jgi:hypothetical protein